MENKHLSLQFRLVEAQRLHRAYLFKETLTLIGLLYASHIENGTKTLKDYTKMYPHEFERELLFRTLLVESRITHKKSKLNKKWNLSEENDVLSRLKASQKPI